MFRRCGRRTLRRADRRAPAGLRLRAFDAARAEEELTRIHALSLEAFSSNHFYQPISLEDFLASYRPVLGAIDPELVLLAEDEAGELAAFLFALPNYAEGPSAEIGDPQDVCVAGEGRRVDAGE